LVGLNFFFRGPVGGAQHPLRPDNCLESIDFTDPGGSEPQSPPGLVK